MRRNDAASKIWRNGYYPKLPKNSIVPNQWIEKVGARNGSTLSEQMQKQPIVLTIPCKPQLPPPLRPPSCEPSHSVSHRPLHPLRHPLPRRRLRTRCSMDSSTRPRRGCSRTAGNLDRSSCSGGPRAVGRRRREGLRSDAGRGR